MTAILNWEDISPVLEKGTRESHVSKRVPFLQDISQLVRQETLEKPQLSENNKINKALEILKKF